MPKASRRPASTLLEFPFVMLSIFLAVLWIAGGASRADVFGQVVVRSVAWIILAAVLVFGRPPRWSAISSVAIFLLTSVVIVAMQLIPLPPDIWTALPGRELLAQSALVSDQPQPWRPISLSPDATVNALSSLIVPIVIVVLMGMQARESRWAVVTLVLVVIVAGCLLALLQFAGSNFDNPLINYVGQVSGNFANRNHMALLAGIGCVLAPVWAYNESESPRWRALVAIGLLLFFVLIILATGSRAGFIFASVGTVLGVLAVRTRLARQVRGVPRKIWIPGAVASAATIVGGIILSIVLGRAASVDRASNLEVGEDLRGLALPTVLDMVEKYWPVGSGFGTYDPAYRISEPDALLSVSYMNQAHNDLLGLVLDGGIFGAALLLAALVWIAINTVRAWRGAGGDSSQIARAGSAILVLIFLASIFDYPARTPMIMAIAVVAAVWLMYTKKSEI